MEKVQERPTTEGDWVPKGILRPPRHEKSNSWQGPDRDVGKDLVMPHKRAQWPSWKKLAELQEKTKQPPPPTVSKHENLGLSLIHI